MIDKKAWIYIKDKKILTTLSKGKAEGTIIKMSCYMADYIGQLKVNSEIAEMVW